MKFRNILGLLALPTLLGLMPARAVGCDGCLGLGSGTLTSGDATLTVVVINGYCEDPEPGFEFCQKVGCEVTENLCKDEAGEVCYKFRFAFETQWGLIYGDWVWTCHEAPEGGLCWSISSELSCGFEEHYRLPGGGSLIAQCTECQ